MAKSKKLTASKLKTVKERKPARTVSAAVPSAPDRAVAKGMKRHREELKSKSAAKLDEAYERLSVVLSNLAEPIVVFDSRGKIITINQAAIKSYGCDPTDLSRHEYQSFLEKLRVRNFNGTIVSSRDLPSSRALRGEQERDRRLIFTDMSGDDHHIEVSNTPLKAGNNITGCVVVWHDISDIYYAELEIHKLNNDLAWRNSELEEANKELESFAYTVSNDLKAPLRSITGFAEAVLEDHATGMDVTGRDYLGRVIAASGRMTQFIDAILTMSRLTRSNLTEETVDLSSLAKSIATELKKKDPERRVEFVITEGARSKGDRAMLRAAMENLLNNAWEFTSKHPEAKIEFGLTAIDGKTAYFVRDDGAGFVMDFADKLFMPFQRLHGAEEFPGIGIGLATVQRIIHRHGGRIWADGEVEKGATFYFTLG